MHWTVRLEATTSAGEVNTTALVTFSWPAMISTLTEVGLILAESEMLLARLPASPANQDSVRCRVPGPKFEAITAITAISDGAPVLPALVRSATGNPIDYILDWFHLSMRVHHVE